jgi:SAM-dependent methyltransferase
MTVTHREALPPLAIRAQLRWDVVRPIMTILSPSTTIEIGTGQGAMGARIATMTSRSYMGLELDETSFELAKARIEPLGGVIHRERLEVIDPAPAQLVCAFEVLEHIEDDRGALETWVRYVAPGGHLLLSVPAHQRRFGPMDTHAGHFRRYSPAELSELVRGAGLVDVVVRLYGAPLGYALEAVRNRIDAKRLADARASGVTMETLTAASGRTFQFERRSWRSDLATIGTLPFRYLQRVWPDGVGLVLLARKPVDLS